MTPTTKAWLHGLGAAFIGSAASSLGSMLVAPAQFNLTSLVGFRNVVLSSLISGALAATLYLKSSPLPPLNQTVEESHAVINAGNTQATVDSVKTTTTSEVK